MTPQQECEAFIKHNSEYEIFAGEWLDKDKRSIVEPEDRAFLRYDFMGGSSVILSREAVYKLNEDGHTVNWRFP